MIRIISTRVHAADARTGRPVALSRLMLSTSQAWRHSSISRPAAASAFSATVSDSLGKPWMWRAKDLWGWWGNLHYDRPTGAESAGHTACYVSPYGDVFPCVQFPLPSGNVRHQKFMDIWRYSGQLNEVRSIKVGDLPVCSGCGHSSTCTRCPGLAYMEGNMRGPSSQDCEKSFARTGIPSANMNLKQARGAIHGLVQISLPVAQPVLSN